MALLWMCGFENGVNEFDYRYTYADVTTTNKRSGTYACGRWYPGGGGVGVKYLSPTPEIYGQVAVFRTGNNVNLSADLVALGDGSTWGFTIRFNSSYYPYMTSPQGTLVGTTSLTSIPLSTWVCYEFHYKIHPTNGFAELRADGQTICYYQGNTNFTTAISQVYMSSPYDTWSLDDIVINDASGTYNNSWTSCQRVVYLPVNTDGSLKQWSPTPAGLTHYTALDEVTRTTGDYVSTLNTTDEDHFQLANLPAAATAIVSVQTCLWGRRTSVSPALPNILTSVLTSGVTTWSSALRLSPDQFSPDWYALKVNWDHNPITGQRWTIDEVNGLVIGIKAST